MTYVFAPLAQPCIPVKGTSASFPVRRIYCVGRNYEDHAKEMGHSGREAPFFFMKPADAILLAPPGEQAVMPYPSLTANLHHEVELVVAIGTGGSNIAVSDALGHIFGYAVGLDMTRRDLQNDLKKLGRPWCIAKGFDHSAPVGCITPASLASTIDQATISLQVNGEDRQRSVTSKMIWNIAETIAQISNAWALQAGDLIFTGTPEGVAAVTRGDVLRGHIDGLQDIEVRLE